MTTVQRTTQKPLGFWLVTAALVLVGVTALGWWYLYLPVGATLTNDSISEELVGADKAVLELNLSAGHLQLWAGSAEHMLVGKVQTLKGIETFERTARAGSASAQGLLNYAVSSL